MACRWGTQTPGPIYSRSTNAKAGQPRRELATAISEVGPHLPVTKGTAILVQKPTLDDWAQAELAKGRHAGRIHDCVWVLAAMAQRAGVDPAALTFAHVQDYLTGHRTKRGTPIGQSTARQYESMARGWIRYVATGDSVRGGRELRTELAAFKTWLMTRAPGRRALRESSATERRNNVSAVARHAGVHPARLTGAHVTAFLADHGHCSIPYVNRLLGSLQVYAAFAAIADPTAGIVRDIPLQTPRRGRPVSDRAVRAMLAIATDTERALMLLGLYCGGRAHELAMICAEDLEIIDDEGNGRLLICDGKGGYARYVPIGAEQIADLAPVYVPGVTTGKLFPKLCGTHKELTKMGAGRRVTTMIRELAARAGVKCTAHQLRHWFASTANEQTGGANLVLIGDLLGHKSLETTKVYLASLAQQDRGVSLSGVLGQRVRGMQRGAA